MKNTLKCSSLIRFVVIIVVMAFMVGRVMESNTFAWELGDIFDWDHNDGDSHDHHDGDSWDHDDGDSQDHHDGDSWDLDVFGCPSNILPAGGNTIAGPGTVHFDCDDNGGEQISILGLQSSLGFPICVTVRNCGKTVLTLKFAGELITINSKETKALCGNYDQSTDIELLTDEACEGSAVWRVDIILLQGTES